MSTVLNSPPPSREESNDRPLLESGDRYTRAEFERRYMARPDIQKAELIEGVVYVASPGRIRRHAVPHALVMTWVGHFVLATPGLLFGNNSTVRLDEWNEPQPDVMLTLDPLRDGPGWIDADDYFAGAPELLMEISGSTASYDLHDKKRAYERNGVREYVVVLTEARQVIWFSLESGQYVELALVNGVYRSVQFPGLWLDPQALLSNDLTRLIAGLDAGLTSPEHQQFVAARANPPA